MIFDDSRYQLAYEVKSTDDRTYYGWREEFAFSDAEGIIPHVVAKGDTLFSLAAQYYSEEGDIALWWAIADFQPEPIIDPTIELTEGEVILIPPINSVTGRTNGLAQDTLSRL
jgi:hypothetical protein